MARNRTKYTYDSLNRLETLRTYNDANSNHVWDSAVDQLLSQYDYDLALDGKRTGVTEKQLVDVTVQETRIDWFYDNLGRLTREQYNGYGTDLDFIADYTYDLVGNRLTKKTDTNPTFSDNPTYDEEIDYAYDANDRLLTETKDVGGTANTADDRFTRYSTGQTRRPPSAVPARSRRRRRSARA